MIRKQAEPIYFCGGNYRKPDSWKPEFEFGLVRPTGGKPYVTRTAAGSEKLFSSCSHHSALYQLIGSTAYKIKESAECKTMRNPEEIQLTHKQIVELTQADPWMGL